jgi:hypothetical protein
MNTKVPVPARRRKPAVEPQKHPSREGLRIIGGPKVCVLAVGVYSEGQSSKQWPFIHGSKLIGLVLDEYVEKGQPVWHAGSNTRPVRSHYWIANHAAGELRYKGTVKDRAVASRLINVAQKRVALSEDSTATQKDAVVYGTPSRRVRSTAKAA